jgi:ribosomal protein L35
MVFLLQGYQIERTFVALPLWSHHDVTIQLLKLDHKSETMSYNWTFYLKYGIFCPLCHFPVAEARSKNCNFMKTNKSFTKRIKVTKNGKLVARKPGQNHFNARQTGRARLARKRTQLLTLSKRITRRFLPGTGA